MNDAQIEAWAAAAGPAPARAVRFAVLEAHLHWLHRTADEHELHDLAPWSVSPTIVPSDAAAAARTAAAELAIICLVWPATWVWPAAAGSGRPSIS